MKALAFLALLVVSASALLVQMERDAQMVGVVPAEWAKVRDASETDIHSVLFSMKHIPAKAAELERIFWEVSDPKHANYGKYVSFEKLTDLLGAPSEAITRVTAFIRASGIPTSAITLGAHRDVVKVTASGSALSALLNTHFAVFKHITRGDEVIRSLGRYYLPSEIAEVVALVENVIRFPAWGSPVKVEAQISGNWPDYCGASCHGEITPKIIQQQYSVTPNTPVNVKNSMAVAEFQGQHYSYTDIDAFTTACALPQCRLRDVYGGNKPQLCDAGACVEALLDIEYIWGVAGPIPLADYWLSTYCLLDWINGVLADTTPSLVHSVSYGNDEVQQTSTSYMLQCNTQFQAAGAKGLTIMFASGDQGVWGRTGRGTTFHPDFPAGSPYITAVGGSDLTSNAAPPAPQTCCTDSGGGFSNTFARPSYQNAAVTAYLSNPSANLPPSSYYNASSRAYPDISAIFGLAIPYCIHSGGKFEGVAGTSASCPVVAAVIANLNNVQLNAGKAQLGFINPWLYSTLASSPSAFTDVVGGTNNQGAGYGFTATTGWDPCTGVGTPVYTNMVKALP